MTTTLDIKELQNRLPGILASAVEGDEIIIGNDGQPVAKVLPHTRPRPLSQRIAGLGKGTMRMGDNFDDGLPDQGWGFDT